MAEKHIKGMDYLNLALIAFGCVGLELLLVVIESFIYGQEISAQHWTQIAHWLLISIIWSCSVYWILKYAKNKYDFNLYQKNNPIKLGQWLLVVILYLPKSTFLMNLGADLKY